MLLIFTSLVLSILSGIGVYSACSKAVQYLYRVKYSGIEIKQHDVKISRWWDETISQKPFKIIQETLTHTISFFRNKKKLDINKILFFSYLFTLMAILIGYFFSSIGSYLAIYHEFPAKIVREFKVIDKSGQIISDPQVINEQWLMFFAKIKSEFFANVVFLLFALFNLILCRKVWSKRNDFSSVFSFYVISSLLILAAKPLTVLFDEIAGRSTFDSKDYLILTILNLFVLYVFFFLIREIRSPKAAFRYFIVILSINVIMWQILTYQPPIIQFYTYFIDGVLNHFLSLYLFNLIFDLITFYFIVRIAYLLTRQSIYFLVAYITIVIVISCLASCLTYLSFIVYIRQIQSVIPELSSQPGVGDIKSVLTFWQMLKSVLYFDFRKGNYAIILICFSTFFPTIILVSRVIGIYWIKIVKKATAGMLGHLYTSSNQSSVTLTTVNIISVFFTFLFMIATFWFTYLNGLQLLR